MESGKNDAARVVNMFVHCLDLFVERLEMSWNVLKRILGIKRSILMGKRWGKDA